jgi:RHS repeat-associated protein
VRVELLGAGSSTTHKFTGHGRDAESGLDYMKARYYASMTGRFLSPDEFTGGPLEAYSASDPLPPGPLPYADITHPQSLNKYAYTFNNSLRYVDPEGHRGETAWDVGSPMTGIATYVSNVKQGNVGSAIVDAIGIAVDAVAVVTPLVPGGAGAALKAARAADKINDIVDGAKAGKQGVTAFERGRQSEKAVLEAEGLTKHTKPMQAVHPKTSTVRGTIPDAIRPNGQTADVKDAKRVNDSPQLRRQSENSARTGQRGQVIVTQRNQRVSTTVQKRMEIKKVEQ